MNTLILVLIFTATIVIADSEEALDKDDIDPANPFEFVQYNSTDAEAFWHEQMEREVAWEGKTQQRQAYLKLCLVLHDMIKSRNDISTIENKTPGQFMSFEVVSGYVLRLKAHRDKVDEEGYDSMDVALIEEAEIIQTVYKVATYLIKDKK